MVLGLSVVRIAADPCSTGNGSELGLGSIVEVTALTALVVVS